MRQRKRPRSSPSRTDDVGQFERAVVDAKAGRAVSLDDAAISAEQFSELVAEATHDREFKPGEPGRTTFGPGSSFSGCRFEDGASFHSLILEDCVFSAARLIDADFYLAVMSNTDLSAVDIRNGILISSKLSDVDLSRADITNAKFYRAGLSNVRFVGADLTKSSFREANLYACDFTGTNLIRTNFRDAHLIGCRFENSTLTNTSFRDATLTESAFKNLTWDPAHPPIWPRGYTPPKNG